MKPLGLWILLLDLCACTVRTGGFTHRVIFGTRRLRINVAKDSDVFSTLEQRLGIRQHRFDVFAAARWPNGSLEMKPWRGTPLPNGAVLEVRTRAVEVVDADIAIDTLKKGLALLKVSSDNVTTASTLNSTLRVHRFPGRKQP